MHRFAALRTRWFAALLAVAALLVTGTALAEDPPSEPAPAPAPAVAPPEGSVAEGCMACHGDPKEAPKHQFDYSTFGRSVHKGQDCTNCHDGFDEWPHPKDSKPMGCAECHEEEAKVVAETVHAGGPREGSTKARAAECKDCHGVHDVFPATVRESRLYPLNVPKTCGACHGGPEAHAEAAKDGKRVDEMHVAGKYTDDTHAKALLVDGLVTAPTCVSCHGGHDVKATKDVTSRVHPSNVAATCGTCHVGIVEKYEKSVHGMTPRDASKTENHRLPATCTDCHPPHHIGAPDQDFKVQIVETCSKCHADRGSTYRGTYHGRITDIGYGGVASCDECHTAHSILPSSHPMSSVGSERIVETCAKCHEGATPRFATYQVHANPNDQENFPVLYWGQTIMRGVITVTWLLAGVHILLWFIRAMIERKTHPHPHGSYTGRWYQRWPVFYRILHITVASTFLLLALTGLPLRFHDEPWAPTIFSILGGPEAVGFLHRLGGAVTFGYFAVFLVHIVKRRLKGEKGLFGGPHSMLPRFKDAQDIAANFRWFLRGGPRPNFDRWTYWEKFDFWAEVWGVGFIGFTGLIMWFPIAFTGIFPGWVVNLAHILHSYEALLATGFIFSVHFFHANLRPGKFPMDPIIFTGRIPEEELRLERPAEYERMKADGRLEREALPPPDPGLVRRAYWVGGTLLSIGLLLLALMLASLWT